jgi:hypothetical protein
MAALTAAAAVVVSPGAARADGALAVGMPANIVKDGFSYGYKVNADNSGDARNAAYDACRDNKVAPASARSQCVLIGNFRNECVAIAMDPEAGTPGVGAAIAATRELAEQRAMGFCRATAGKSRREFCKIDAVACDGSAKN